MPDPERPQVTIQPDQARRLGDLADAAGGALRITEEDHEVLHVKADKFSLRIDASGKTIGAVTYIHPDQE